MTRYAGSFLLLSLFGTSAMAFADTAEDTFTISEAGRTITFPLPASPTPDSSQTGDAFVLDSVTVRVNGAPMVEDIVFAKDAYGIGPFAQLTAGGYDVAAPLSEAQFSVGALYSGSEADPTFVVGSYGGGEFVPDEKETLTIAGPAATMPVSATPEPGTMVLLGTGLLGGAGALRRRVLRRG